jgi:hypothetical protein
MIPVALGLLLASLIHLGPETPVGTRASGAAASNQYAPSVAWNGHSGLVVWTDQRSNYPADVPNPRIVPPQMLRVSPMRADGSLVNPEGTPLIQAYFGRVASNGSSFMLVYVAKDGIYTVPLNENGEIDGVQTLVSGGGVQFDIVSNHHTFLFVSTLPPDGGIQAIVLQPSGIPTAVKTFSTAYPQFAPAVTALGDVYALAYLKAPCQPCPTTIDIALMAEDAATTDVPVADGGGPLALAASDDRLMLAMIGPDGIQTLTAGRDLKVIAPFKTVAPLPNEYALIPMFWDGESFLVTLFQNNSDDWQWDGIRVSPDNVPLDAYPAPIARDRPSGVGLVRTSDRIVAVWSNTNDVYSRNFPTNADLYRSNVSRTPAVFSAHAQSQMSAASSGVRVWREGSLDTRIMLSTGDRTTEAGIALNGGLRNPSVAAGGNVILVLWREVAPYRGQLADYGYRVYMRRFTRDGTPLDAYPMLVAAGDSDFVDLDLSTAVAFDGRNFVAIWSAGTYTNQVQLPSVRAIRIAPDGTLVDSAPFFIAGVSDLGYTTSLRAISTGNELLVAWSTWNDYRNIHGIAPLPSPRTAIEIVRLDTQSSSMNVLDKREIWNDGDLAKQIDLAWTGTNALLASVHHGCVTLTLLDAALATKNENASAECATANPGKSIEHPAVAWNGSEFVAAWAADEVHAIRFDRTLQPLDAAPFTIAPDGTASHEPSLVASPSGVEITYERLDDDVPRLFTRELDRLGIVPRTRSIR